MSWQPIETAPKNGMTVLLWEPCRFSARGRISLGSFREDDMRPDLGAMWLQNDYDDFSCGMASTPVRPQFWMSLPEPPASVGRNPKGQDHEDGLGAQHEHAVAKPDAQNTGGNP